MLKYNIYFCRILSPSDQLCHTFLNLDYFSFNLVFNLEAGAWH